MPWLKALQVVAKSTAEFNRVCMKVYQCTCSGLENIASKTNFRWGGI